MTTKRLPQTHLFATKADLAPGLTRADSAFRLKYVEYLDPGPVPATFGSLLEVPDLGRARTGDHMTGHTYLVVPATAQVPVKAVPLKGGKVQHMIDLDRAPAAAIIFRPGGLFEERALICGHVGPVGDGSESRELYRGFVRELTRGFEKIKAYSVGPEAARLLDAGWRLVTISVRSPVEYDLRR